MLVASINFLILVNANVLLDILEISLEFVFQILLLLLVLLDHHGIHLKALVFVIWQTNTISTIFVNNAQLFQVGMIQLVFVRLGISSRMGLVFHVVLMLIILIKFVFVISDIMVMVIFAINVIKVVELALTIFPMDVKHVLMSHILLIMESVPLTLSVI